MPRLHAQTHPAGNRGLQLQRTKCPVVENGGLGGCLGGADTSRRGHSGAAHHQPRGCKCKCKCTTTSTPRGASTRASTRTSPIAIGSGGGKGSAGGGSASQPRQDRASKHVGVLLGSVTAHFWKTRHALASWLTCNQQYRGGEGRNLPRAFPAPPVGAETGKANQGFKV
jgi:hypothetical protein